MILSKSARREEETSWCHVMTLDETKKERRNREGWFKINAYEKASDRKNRLSQKRVHSFQFIGEKEEELDRYDEEGNELVSNHDVDSVRERVVMHNKNNIKEHIDQNYDKRWNDRTDN